MAHTSPLHPAAMGGVASRALVASSVKLGWPASLTRPRKITSACVCQNVLGSVGLLSLPSRHPAPPSVQRDLVSSSLFPLLHWWTLDLCLLVPVFDTGWKGQAFCPRRLAKHQVTVEGAGSAASLSVAGIAGQDGFQSCGSNHPLAHSVLHSQTVGTVASGVMPR